MLHLIKQSLSESDPYDGKCNLCLHNAYGMNSEFKGLKWVILLILAGKCQDLYYYMVDYRTWLLVEAQHNNYCNSWLLSEIPVFLKRSPFLYKRRHLIFGTCENTGMQLCDILINNLARYSCTN